MFSDYKFIQIASRTLEKIGVLNTKLFQYMTNNYQYQSLFFGIFSDKIKSATSLKAPFPPFSLQT